MANPHGMISSAQNQLMSCSISPGEYNKVVCSNILLSKNIVHLISLYMGYNVNNKTAKPPFDNTDTAVAINWAHLQCLNALALLS